MGQIREEMTVGIDAVDGQQGNEAQQYKDDSQRRQIGPAPPTSQGQDGKSDADAEVHAGAAGAQWQVAGRRW
jgi:hypothetical protein